MDYLKEAFGGLNPQADKDAALKFSLDVLLADHRIDDLTKLATQRANFGGVEGEPGWIIECREYGDVRGYEHWPVDACYRAYVQPEIYCLTHPEFFCDELTFFRYVHSIINVYMNRFPDRSAQVSELMGVIKKAGAPSFF